MARFVPAVCATLMLSPVLPTVVYAQSIPARVCKPAVSGNGASYIQHVAKKDSVNNWQMKVRERYGDDWADYSTAKVNRFPCNRDGWFTQSCVVKAEPCREVGNKDVQG